MSDDDESERYLPESEFLNYVFNDEIPLSGSAMGDANLARLIDMTTDADRSNRDWAVFLLMQSGLDSPPIRAAFVRALDDADEDVRAEALIGIAQRDRAFALPLVKAQLDDAAVHALTIEAATYVANPALLPPLRALAEAATDEPESYVKTLLDEAIECCRTGEQADWAFADDD